MPKVPAISIFKEQMSREVAVLQNLPLGPLALGAGRGWLSKDAHWPDSHHRPFPSSPERPDHPGAGLGALS